MGQTERDRLKNYYSPDNYNPTTNPGGMANDGHRKNFVPALQDVSVVGSDVANCADRAEAAANQSGAWKEVVGAVVRVNATTFTIVGDWTSTYKAKRAVFLDQTTDAYGFVVSSSYASGTGLTTIVVSDCVVGSGLTHVYYGQDPSNAPKAADIPPNTAQILYFTNNFMTP